VNTTLCRIDAASDEAAVTAELGIRIEPAAKSDKTEPKPHCQGSHPGRAYVKGGMVPEFTPGLIDAMVESFDPADGLFLGTHTAGGAVARVGETETAWPHRNVATMINIGGFWTDPADDEPKRRASRNVFAALEPHTGGYYDNIQSETTNVSGNYGPAYDRLVSVKNAFDPMNLFRLNSNVRPTV